MEAGGHGEGCGETCPPEQRVSLRTTADQGWRLPSPSHLLKLSPKRKKQEGEPDLCQNLGKKAKALGHNRDSGLLTVEGSGG